jgi:hypothetical protein
LDLLTELHRSIDRVAEDLSVGRPELAAALRREASWIPRPEEVARHPPPQLAPPDAARACSALRPLLYDALDEGVVDARRFDSLMLRRARAARALRERAR